MTLDPQLLNILKTQCSSLGSNFNHVSSSQVLAADVNQLLFTKLSSQIPQVLAEAQSLSLMENACGKDGACSSLTPKVHAFGTTEKEDKAYLITDYRQLSGRLNNKAQRSLGEKLAKMHLNGSNDRFGFDRPTFCGVTKQDNTWSDSWSRFFTEQRIGDIVSRIGDSELTALHNKMKESVYPILFNRFDAQFKPSLIHGDLWSGNSGVDQDNGDVIIFDPSSSYSHNEMELGIMHMFGGYNSQFFEAYHEIIPKLQPHYDQRVKAYELYHHLNHALMFGGGGGYKGGAVSIMQSLIQFGEKESKKQGAKSEL